MTKTTRPPAPLQAQHKRLLRKLAEGYTAVRVPGGFFQVGLRDTCGRIVDYVGRGAVVMLENRGLVDSARENGRQVWRIASAGRDFIEAQEAVKRQSEL